MPVPESWLPLLVCGLLGGLIGWYWFGRRRPRPVNYADEREERLTLAVARMAGCSPARALPAVRREVELSPTQADEVLIKRAAYHYRQDRPTFTCQTYRDRAPG
jgi:hypothetical protein